MDGIYYIGLRKVQQIVAAYGADLVAETTAGSDDTSTWAMSPSVSTKATQQTTWRVPDLASPIEAIRQLPRARQVIEPGSRDYAEPQLSPGDWIRFSGPCRFGVMRRDSGGTPDGRPWCAYWLLPTLVDHATHARWLVLTGTADSNLVDRWNGEFPGNRSGSSTESFFDLIRSYAHEEAVPTHTLSVAHYIERASWMAGMGDLDHQPSAGLAYVHRALTCQDSGYSEPAHDGSKYPVTELVIATPLYVSHLRRPDPPVPPATEQAPVRTVWSRLFGR